MELIKKHKNALEFTSIAGRNQKAYLGLEIEFDSAYSRESAWDTGDALCDILREYGIRSSHKSDGSLERGRELVINPITIDVVKHHLAPAFVRIFEFLREKGWHDEANRCGGHVHISRRTLGRDKATQESNAKSIAKWLWDNRDALLKFSRRREYALRRWANFENPAEYFDINGAGQGRYVAFNLTNKDTFEFRFFSAHKDVSQLLARLELVNLIVKTVTGWTGKRLNDYTLDELVLANRRHLPTLYYEYIATRQ